STLYAALGGPSTVVPGTAFNTVFGLVNVTSNVYALDFTFSYGISTIDFMSVESLQAEFNVMQIKTDVPGQIRIIGAGTISNNGGVFKLNWLAKSNTQDQTVSFNLQAVTAANGTGQILQVTPVSLELPIGMAAANKSTLQNVVNIANAQYVAAVEGTLVGQYTSGSKAALLGAILTAENVLSNNSATQQQVDSASNSLNQALQMFNAAVNTTYARGDLNHDSVINIADLGLIAANYGKSTASQDWNEVKNADYNHDGKIDIIDLVAIARLIIT
ncbi:cohesin domain-containing protein, partial [Paenibacillus sp. TAF58]